MKNAEVKVGGVPLHNVNWENQGKGFVASRGGEATTLTRFSTDSTGQIWNIEGGSDNVVYHVAVFCLGLKQKDWSIQPVGTDTKLPPKSTIDLINRLIADVRGKNASHFLNYQTE